MQCVWLTTALDLSSTVQDIARVFSQTFDSSKRNINTFEIFIKAFILHVVCYLKVNMFLI